MRRILPCLLLTLSLVVLGAGCGSDSSPTGPKFSTDPPVLLTPAEGASLDVYPRVTTLTWEPVTLALSYDIEVDTCLGTCGDRIVEHQTYHSEDTTVTFTFGGANPGRWRVRAVGSIGITGQWSEWRDFQYLR